MLSAWVVNEGVESARQGPIQVRWVAGGCLRVPNSLCVSLSTRALLVVGVGASQVVQIAEDMPERGREEEGVIFRYMGPKLHCGKVTSRHPACLLKAITSGMSQSGACSRSTRCSG